jgi:CRISPR-associated protein Csh2
MSQINSGEILFIKAVKDGIPNRDPLNESDARRIFGEEDGRISLSDVSVKRDVRDYVLAKYPDGGEHKSYFVYCREERTEDGRLLGRQKLAEEIKTKVGLTEQDMQKVLVKSAFDVRVFGVVYSVSNHNFKLTGPVQFGWAHSLHPVETKYVQGTVIMPSKDTSVNEQGDEEGQRQGTIWTTYTLPFALFAMPGVINANIAQGTGMSDKDVELLLEALWRGTQHRQARGRGFQQPVLLVHVEYKDPFFRLGFLEDYLSIEPGREEWLKGKQPSSLEEVKLDVQSLAELLIRNKDKIARIRYWISEGAQMIGELPGERSSLW